MHTIRRLLIVLAGLLVVSMLWGTQIALAQGPSDAHTPCRAMTNLFRAFAMSPPQLRDYLANGGTFEDLAVARDVDLVVVEAQWQTDMTACVEHAAAAGDITPEHAQGVMAALASGELTGIPRDNPDSFFDVFVPGVHHTATRGEGPRPANAPPTEEGAPYDSPGDDTIASADQPDGETIFAPGGWGMHDRPPRGEGVLGPGGWGAHDRPPQGDGVFHPGGWGTTDDPQVGDGVFSPGGWGVHDDTSQGEDVHAPGGWGAADDPQIGEGVFMPGGWGWVDQPQFNDLSDAANPDGIDHPYYAGIFMPGGWGMVNDHAPNHRIDQSDGANIQR